MWSYVRLALGLLLVLGGVGNLVSLSSGQIEDVARGIVENGVDTTGVVEKRERHIVAARYGKAVGGGVYYTMSYSFTTLDGEKFGGKINLSKDQAYSVNDGEQIAVRYLKGQPSINAPVRFKSYMSEADVEDLPFWMIGVTSVLFLLGGLWLCWASWQRIRPAPQPVMTAAAISRINAIGRQGSGQPAGFGRR